MKIGIVGVGYVGGAMFESFSKKSQRTNNSMVIVAYDKFKKIGSFEDVLDAKIIFLCLPTLYDEKTSSYDKTAINEVCDDLVKKSCGALVVIKSTIEPTVSQKLADTYQLPIVHNPEFLTARTACQDFNNQKHIILGKTSTVSDDQINILVDFYQCNYPAAEITVCNSTESESVKLFCNCFYAVKVQFFNELYILCQKLGVDYNVIKNTMIKNSWINPMHTDVPGPDHKLSYGGACFPKDTSALLAFMKAQNTPHQVLQATINERNQMRSDE